jgi:CO/xanthine dehydrogenase Mo-binding subunit
MRVVRSQVAHGNILAMDTAAARALPGVEAVWTFCDIAHLGPIDFRLTRVAGLDPYRQYALAKDRVRYVGEPIAVVFATDPYVAEDAADLIAPEIEEIPVWLDAAGPVFQFATGHSSEPTTIVKQYGDLDSAFQAAAHIIELELSIGRHSGVPLETRGLIARHEKGRDVLEVYGAAKTPHWNRATICRMLGRPLASVHFYEGHVGGGFGIRGELYPEDVLVCAAALRLGRPVKWIEDRREHLVAANHSRQQRHRIRAAVSAEGVVLALDDEFWHDQGAYVRTHGATVPDLTAAMLPGPYRIPAYRSVGHIRLTNKTPCGTYRSPGRYESTFVRERVMDAVAARLKLDALEVRRRNFITPEQMPFTRGLETLGTEVVLDSGDYPKLLAKTLERVGWSGLQGDIERRRAGGEKVGVGVAVFVEKSGLGPFDGVRITVDDTGFVEIVTGAASVGQGVETVIAQIAADGLGVAIDRITVRHGRTDLIDYGMGAFASRVTVATGAATMDAANKVRAKALEVAAELLQAAPEDLDIRDGVVAAAGGSGASISLADIARALSPVSAHRAGRSAGLTAEGWFHTEHMTYPYGVHVAVVSLDTSTGGVRVEKATVGYDIGRCVNPMLVEGQIHGGLVQGLGGALLEQLIYDERGQPLAVTLADYLMPTSAEAPVIDVLITEDAPTTQNPLGVKGAGEAGSNAIGAAIAAAIDDALREPGAVTSLPVSPVWVRSFLRSERAPM